MTQMNGTRVTILEENVSALLTSASGAMGMRSRETQATGSGGATPAIGMNAMTLQSGRARQITLRLREYAAQELSATMHGRHYQRYCRKTSIHALTARTMTATEK